MLDLQKASMWKRISAFLFDGILLSVIAVLAALVLSSILGYDGYMEKVNAAYERFGAEYGVNLRMSISEYEALDEAGKANFMAANEAINSDAESTHAYGMVVQLSLLIVSLGLLTAFAALEFAVPLLFKNGQTLGKKIFGIAVIHTNLVKMNAPMLFARTVLGKYAVETMVPAYIILMILFGTMGMTGIAVLGLIALLQIIMLIATNTNSAIHDLLAKTVVVDLGSQMIFETEQEMIACKKKLHAEKVKNTAY